MSGGKAAGEQVQFTGPVVIKGDVTITTDATSGTNGTADDGKINFSSTSATILGHTSGTTALTDFSDTTWSSSSITARGCLIYNSSTTAGTANRAVAILDFGADKTSTSGDFTIQFPPAAASNAIIRIA